MKKPLPSTLLAIACTILATGCDRGDEGKARVARVRPVLSTVVEPPTGARAVFAGTIEPRYSTTLAFRVMGRVIAREVSVGDTVGKGTRLAALDPVPYDLSVRNARAALADATAQLSVASAEEARLRRLLEENHVSAQQYEAIQQAREGAKAAVAQTGSILDKALEQRGYADLAAEFDGVVTAVATEVNQVVTPGQPIVVIARPDVREAVIDLPDDAAVDIRDGSPFRIALQIAPSEQRSGRVREIAPRVDPLTHSRRIRIALEDPPPAFRLGTMITAYAEVRATGPMRIPATALLERGGARRVWVVDPQSRKVHLREVTVAGLESGVAEIAAGLEVGERVVTAGVHSLDEGQSVRIPDEAIR